MDSIYPDWGKIGVDIFILISGYFLISVQSIKTSKVIKLWGQIFFYSIVIFVLFVSTGIKPFGVKEFIKHIAPITFSQWWFASAYFVLYLLVPFINKLLNTFSKRQYLNFLAVLAFCWCIIPTFTGQAFQSNDLLWFIFLYSLAGYFKLFGLKTNLSSTRFIGISFICIILTFMSVIVFDVLGTKMAFFGAHATFFYDMQRLPILVISVLMFLGFSKLNIQYSRVINVISSAAFGVYLIHDDRYVRPFFWKTIFQNSSYSESNMLIPHSLLVIAAVFAGCTIIELLRIYLLEKNYMPAIHKLAKFIDENIHSALDRIANTLNR